MTKTPSFLVATYHNPATLKPRYARRYPRVQQQAQPLEQVCSGENKSLMNCIYYKKSITECVEELVSYRMCEQEFHASSRSKNTINYHMQRSTKLCCGRATSIERSSPRFSLGVQQDHDIDGGRSHPSEEQSRPRWMNTHSKLFSATAPTRLPLADPYLGRSSLEVILHDRPITISPRISTHKRMREGSLWTITEV
ncbi:hypothetical protein PROFUN_09858 [Planoprotostelium fungivorum]|uniref:CHCH domain-containing protein n=1 Tax=Planoprotostelium fungivorum TaxID=1890364 RepID=A0A2P6NFN0_9EUKA|nr:hypothetical protein PROFUN_09858 [Planoprotostelium fungivorum]